MERVIEAGKKKKRKPTLDQLRVIENPVEIDIGTLLYVRAYADLSTCKAIGFGAAGAVPVTAIWAWCDRHRLTALNARLLERVIRSVDQEMLARQRKPAAASVTKDDNR